MCWLENVIVEGIQTCVTLKLKNTPAYDTLDKVVSIWVAVFERQPIAWDAKQDYPRIREAFLRVLGECEEFPTPKKVLDFMPKRKATMPMLPRPAPKPMPEGVRAEMDRVLRMTPGECAAEAGRILNNMMRK